MTRRPSTSAVLAWTIYLLLVLAGSLRSAEPSADSAAAAKPGLPPFRLVVWSTQPSDELKLAAEAVGLAVEWRASERGDLVTAAVSPRGSGAAFTTKQLRGNQSPQGFRVTNMTTGDLVLSSSTQHGLANGLYEVRRSLLLADPEKIKPEDLFSVDEHKPFFAHRATYQFLAPWNLPNLNGAALTLEQWKAHLERMRRLNVNQFYFDLWADQFYHPDHPDTLANKALYDRMREVCDFAHRLGMRTGMFVFPCQVPTSVYQAHPEARGVEAINYHGIHLCPSRAWDATNEFNTFAIEYFGRSLDDVVVEMQDPGSCLCAECCRQFPELVLRFIETYRKIPGGPDGRRIDLCSLHFRDWLEEPEIDSRVAAPIKDLRKRVFERLPKGTLLFDSDRATLELGRRHKLKPVYFFFDLDPESGIENQQVFPHVKLERVERQIRESVERADEGMLAYRMMPLTQYVSDYVLFRETWDPHLAANPTLEVLAAELGILPAGWPRFAQAMRDLDAWDAHHDLDALQAANQLLAAMAIGDVPSGLLLDLRDLVAVQAMIGEYWAKNAASIARPDFFPPPELVEQAYKLMVDRPIFAAYTVDQHWELRAREMIGQRLRWWLQALGPAKQSDD